MQDLLASLGLGADEGWVVALAPALRIVLIVALAWILRRASGRLLVQLRERVAWRIRDAENARRAEKLVRVMRHLASACIFSVAALVVMSELGVSVAPLIATVGIAGIALGLGAQSVIKDWLNGVCMLLEDQIRQGDVVEITGRRGLVEEVTLRYVRLRDIEGAVHFIPNGALGAVINRSRGHAYAVADLRVGDRESVEHVFELLRAVARTMREDREFAAHILGDLEITGVDELGESGTTIKCRFKVRPLEQWTMRQEFLRRIKACFDSEGIRMPLPRLRMQR